LRSNVNYYKSAKISGYAKIVHVPYVTLNELETFITKLKQRLIHSYDSPSLTEDDHGRNPLYYALKRGSPEMVHDIVESLSEPQPLMRMCRMVIRRTIRDKLGNGHRLKPQIDMFKKYEVPKAIKRFLAYDP
jgi:hypothetical protein